MIAKELDEDQIDGLSRLFLTFPRESSFEGAYLMGVLLHDNDDVQLTYTIRGEKTYIVAFRLMGCPEHYDVSVPTHKGVIAGIDIYQDPDGSVVFSDKTNEICMTCKRIKVFTNEILGKQHGEEQKVVLSERYIKSIIKKFDGIEDLSLPDGSPLFRRDDSYNGIVSYEMIMYKLPSLKSADGRLEYEFLIEFDKSDPCVGIYYGCKGLMLSGDTKIQQERLESEWAEHIKPHVCKKLNAIFKDKKFDNRFKPTDNADNNTFWPFWISLYEDENILEVAVRAVIIIRAEYKRFIEGQNFVQDDTCRYVVKSRKGRDGEVCLNDGEAHSESRLTFENYELLMNPWKEENLNKKWRALFDKFIKRSIEAGLIAIDEDGYEKAFQFKGGNISFVVLIQLLVNRIDSDSAEVPWGIVCNQFLDKKGNLFNVNSAKAANNRFWQTEKPKFWSRNKCEFETWYLRDRMKFEAESGNKIVVMFRELMK